MSQLSGVKIVLVQLVLACFYTWKASDAIKIGIIPGEKLRERDPQNQAWSCSVTVRCFLLFTFTYQPIATFADLKCWCDGCRNKTCVTDGVCFTQMMRFKDGVIKKFHR